MITLFVNYRHDVYFLSCRYIFRLQVIAVKFNAE